MKFSLQRFLLAAALGAAVVIPSACADGQADRTPRGQVEVIYSDLCIDCEDEIEEPGVEPAVAKCPPPCGEAGAENRDGCDGCRDS